MRYTINNYTHTTVILLYQGNSNKKKEHIIIQK